MLSFQQDVCDAPANRTAPEANQQWIPMAELMQVDQIRWLQWLRAKKTSKHLVFLGKIRLRTSTDGLTILFDRPEQVIGTS